MRVHDALADAARFALRRAKRSPLPCACIVASLVAGIVPVTASFAFVDAMLFRALPYPDEVHLVQLQVRDVRTGRSSPMVPYALFETIERQRPGLVAVAFIESPSLWFLEAHPEPVPVRVASVSEGFFTTLGIKPARGAGFSTHNFHGGDAVIITDHFWRSALGADANLIGRAIQLSEGKYTLAGVLPAYFVWPALMPTPDVIRTAPPSGGRLHRDNVGPVLTRLADGTFRRHRSWPHRRPRLGPWG